ncbi:MAG: cell wall hydrolase [Bacillota bacterium]
MLRTFRSPVVKKVLAITNTLVFLVALNAPALGAWVYNVQKGDSLYKIAKKTDVPVESIREANGLRTTRIQANQKLVIPTSTGTTASKSSGATSTAKSSGWTYTVRRGDSLYSIAKKVDFPIAEIRRINGLTGSRIIVGQKLTIPYRGNGSSSGSGENTATKATTAAKSTASRGISVSAADVELLARLIYAESRGESFTGQVAVGAVILNRVASKNFPSSISKVIYAPGQFCTVRDGQINRTPNATAYKAAQAALKGQDPTGGAVYFYNPAKTTSRWIWSRPVSIKIGSHVFAR